jgi:hypothetical protein
MRNLPFHDTILWQAMSGQIRRIKGQAYGETDIVPEKDVKIYGGLFGARKRDSDTHIGGDGTKTLADWLLVSRQS